MKNRIYILALFMVSVCRGQITSQLIYIVDNDTVTDVSKIRLIYENEGTRTQLNNLNQIVLNPITNVGKQRIILIVNKDSVAFFDSEDALPGFEWLTKNNYDCFKKGATIWRIYIDSFPFQLDGLKMLNPKRKKKYISLGVLDCVEQYACLPDDMKNK